MKMLSPINKSSLKNSLLKFVGSVIPELEELLPDDELLSGFDELLSLSDELLSVSGELLSSVDELLELLSGKGELLSSPGRINPLELLELLEPPLSLFSALKLTKKTIAQIPRITTTIPM